MVLIKVHVAVNFKEPYQKTFWVHFMLLEEFWENLENNLSRFYSKGKEVLAIHNPMFPEGGIYEVKVKNIEAIRPDVISYLESYAKDFAKFSREDLLEGDLSDIEEYASKALSSEGEPSSDLKELLKTIEALK